MPEADRVDDPVADALLGDSTYERIRQLRYTPLDQPIPTKLAWQSGLLLLLALVLPLMSTFPVEVRDLFGGAIPSSSPVMLLIGLLGGGAVFVGGLALTAIGLLRVRFEPQMTEDLAHQLLSAEDVASLLGTVTGGLFILLTMASVLVGHVGIRAVRQYAAVMRRSPFAPSGVEPATAGTVTTLAFVGSVALLVASRGLYLEHRFRLGER